MRKLLFLFLFCHAFLSNAQENYKTGFVVKNNGDTLRGSIDYKNWGKNSREVAFKTAANTVQQVFSYRNIRAFGCEASAKDWEYYESFSVDIEKSPYLLNDLNRDRKLYFQHDTLFLQLLLNGKQPLYLHRESNGREHFYAKTNENAVKELVYKQYLSEKYNKVLSVDLYKTDLIALLSDCKKITSAEILALPYKLDAIVTLFKHYNNCNGEEKSNYESKAEPIVTEFGLIAGTTFARVPYNFREGYFFAESFNLTGGVQFNLHFPHTNKHWFLHNELLIHGYRSSYTLKTPQNNIDLTLSASYLRLINAMQYQWNGSNYQPFINLGISSALALTSELTYQNKTEKNVLSSYQQGLVLGGGANSGKYSLELRAEFINEAYQFPDWLTNVFLDPKYISLLVGYRF